MSATPIFSSIEEVQAGVRLTGLKSGSDGERLLQDGVAQARTLIYRRLGKTKVDALVAINPVDDPETEDEVRRSVAIQVEIKMVRRELMRSMRNLFLDGSHQVELAWNQEGLLRDLNEGQLTDPVGRLSNSIEQDLSYLEGGATEDQLRMSVVGPTCPPRPNDSIFRRPESVLFSTGGVL